MDKYVTNRRSFMKTASALALFGGGTGASLAQSAASPPDAAELEKAARAEGKFLWYTTNALDVSQAAARDFERAYPGISVEIARFVGPQQYQRFMEEVAAGQHAADIVNISDRPMVTSLIADGHLAEWRIPTYDQLPADARLGSHAYSPFRLTLCLIYNQARLSEEEVRLLEAGWQNVIDPRFKGRFAVTTQKSGAIYAGVQLMSSSGAFPPDFFQKVAAQQPAVYNDLLVPIDRVVAGEHDFTFWSWDGRASSLLETGAPVRFLYPRPTPSYPNQFFAVSAYAPHGNAARLFLNWLTSKEAAPALQQSLGSATMVDGVPDQRSFTREPWFRPIAEVYDVDFNRWENSYDKDFEPWIKAFAAG